VLLELKHGEKIKGDREEVKRDLGGALGAIGDLIGGDSYFVIC
jgi:hypothetical protein